MRPITVILLLVPAASAAWAFAPIGRSLKVTHGVRQQEGTAAPSVPLAPLDVEAFRCPLWVAPPAAPPPAAPPPPLPALRLQLLAIVKDGTGYRAMIYDPDADRVFAAGTGDTAAGRKVERVTASDVQLRDGGGLRTLALREGNGR